MYRLTLCLIYIYQIAVLCPTHKYYKDGISKRNPNKNIDHLFIDFIVVLHECTIFTYQCL